MRREEGREEKGRVGAGKNLTKIGEPEKVQPQD